MLDGIGIMGRKGEIIILPCFSILSHIETQFKRSSINHHRRKLIISIKDGNKQEFQLTTSMSQPECLKLEQELFGLYEMWKNEREHEYREFIQKHPHLFFLGEWRWGYHKKTGYCTGFFVEKTFDFSITYYILFALFLRKLKGLVVEIYYIKFLLLKLLSVYCVSDIRLIKPILI